MARKPNVKDLVHTRLASTYGGWMYCDHCGQNIGYLCYVTYDNFKFEYKCHCGGQGSVHIAFSDVKPSCLTPNKLVELKNRLCCPKDVSPLLTILEKKLISYHFEIDCISCQTRYTKENAY